MSRALVEGDRVFLRNPSARDRDEFLERAHASRDAARPVGDRSVRSRGVRRLPRTGEDHRDRRRCSSAATRTERSSACTTSARSTTGRLRSAYLGYYAFAPFAGQGYMREGIRLTLRHAFGPLGLHRLEANIQPENAPSIALVKRCGLPAGGLSPRYLKIGGRWRDHERWAILAEDVPGPRGAGPRTKNPAGYRLPTAATPRTPGDLRVPTRREQRWIVTQTARTRTPGRTRRSARSPSGSPRPICLSEGPVRVPAGLRRLRTTALGPGGAFLALDRRRAGGFFVSPQSLLARQRDGPQLQERRSRAGPTADIYAYWQGQVGHLGIVHDRSAAARGQPVPGRPARRRALAAAALTRSGGPPIPPR